MSRRSKQLAGIWASDWRPLTYWERCLVGWQLWLDNVQRWPWPAGQTNPEMYPDDVTTEFTVGSLIYPIQSQPSENKSSDIDYSGCVAVGVGGYHSQSYGDDGQCDWCGAAPESQPSENKSSDG